MKFHGWGQRGNYPLPPARTDPETGRRLCRWCDTPIPKGSRRLYWCGETCITEYRWRGDWNFIREKIIARDFSNGCAVCGGQRYHPVLPPDERAAGRELKGYWLARAAVAHLRARGDKSAEIWGPHNPVARGWEVDHILPIVEGGTDVPSNLRLLCTACHRDITRRWRSARAAARSPQLDLL